MTFFSHRPGFSNFSSLFPDFPVCRMTKKNCCYQNGKKGVFLARKGLCTISNKGKIRKIREKRGKIRKTWSMTEKKVRIFGRENGNFFRKNVIWVREKFFRPPQTRRQVSATA